MTKIINIVPILKSRKNMPKGYGVLFEHYFRLAAYVEGGDIENRNCENEKKAIAKTIEAFDELMDMWRCGDLDEALEDARELRCEMYDLDNEDN